MSEMTTLDRVLKFNTFRRSDVEAGMLREALEELAAMLAVLKEVKRSAKGLRQHVDLATVAVGHSAYVDACGDVMVTTTVATEDIVITTIATLKLLAIPEELVSLRFTPAEARAFASALVRAAESAEAFIAERDGVK